MNVPINRPEAQIERELAAVTIRELTAAYPDTLAILAPYGIDLCCGGAHPLGEALELHGAPREAVLRAVAAAVAAAEFRRG